MNANGNQVQSSSKKKNYMQYSNDDRFFCARIVIVSETLKALLHPADQKAIMITQIFDTISP